MSIVGKIFVNIWEFFDNNWEHVCQLSRKYLSIVKKMFVNSWENGWNLMKLDKIELELRNVIYFIFVFVEKPIWYFITTMKNIISHWKETSVPKLHFFVFFLQTVDTSNHFDLFRIWPKKLINVNQIIEHLCSNESVRSHLSVGSHLYLKNLIMVIKSSKER